MRNKLSSFRYVPIFIDANIFVYHAAGSKYTESAAVIDEAAYILIINKGLELLDSKSPRKVREMLETDRNFAEKCYSVLKDFIGYVKSLENLKLLEITGDDAFRIPDYGIAYLLHPKDSLHLAVMKRYRIFDIATNDSDFDRVDWVRVWYP